MVLKCFAGINYLTGQYDTSRDLSKALKKIS
jgi:hypothetical protein